MVNKESVADEAKKILAEEASIREDEQIIQCLANDCNALQQAAVKIQNEVAEMKNPDPEEQKKKIEKF